MNRPAPEVADIFRAHGPTLRQQQRGHLSLGQLKVMSAIEQCRSAALGGHSLRCSACAEPQIAYNSCRNRHCPKCQASAAQRWLEARRADLLPVPYYHVVFTLPAPISAIAYTNKEIIYGLLFDVAAETLRTIAADPKHLGARIGTTLVLHTWGSALTHHPHVHGIVPGGGLAAAGDRWVSCKPGFFLSVRVLSRRPVTPTTAAPITVTPDLPSCAGTAARQCSSSRPSPALSTSADRRVRRCPHDPDRRSQTFLPGGICLNDAVTHSRGLVLQNGLQYSPASPVASSVPLRTWHAIDTNRSLSPDYLRLTSLC